METYTLNQITKAIKDIDNSIDKNKFYNDIQHFENSLKLPKSYPTISMKELSIEREKYDFMLTRILNAKFIVMQKQIAKLEDELLKADSKLKQIAYDSRKFSDLANYDDYK